MPNKIDKCVSKIKQACAEMVNAAAEYERRNLAILELQSIFEPISWNELQRRLFPNAADKLCPRIFLDIDQWKCTCECSKCREGHVPNSVLQILSDFHSQNPFS